MTFYTHTHKHTDPCEPLGGSSTLFSFWEPVPERIINMLCQGKKCMEEFKIKRTKNVVALKFKNFTISDLDFFFLTPSLESVLEKL